MADTPTYVPLPAIADFDSRTEAAADFRRVKSDAWSGPEASLPKHMYFNERGARNFELPERWPPAPPAM